MRKFLPYLASLAIVGIVAVAVPASAALDPNAANPMVLLQQTNIQSGTATPLPVVIGNVIKIVLGLLGIILVVLMVYAGFLWMTAGGDSEKVDEAKAIIKNAIIGIIITFLAYAITGYVIDAITRASTS
jgi:uncharacterized membrane protein